jgi:hypothetical protein
VQLGACTFRHRPYVTASRRRIASVIDGAAFTKQAGVDA